MLARGIEITRLVVLTNGSGMSERLHGRGLRGDAETDGAAIGDVGTDGAAIGGVGQRPRIGYDAGHGTGGGGERRGEERSPTLALPSLEVAVRGADAVLAGLELIAVHGDAHRAARLTPLGAGRTEDLVEALALGLLLDLLASGNDQDAEPGGNVAAAQYRSRRAHVLDPAVGARSDEDNVELLAGNRAARRKTHVGERALEVVSGARLDVRQGRNSAGHRHAHSGVGAVRDHRF